MTDDLVKRLREGDHFEKVMSAEQAADRIEALEAKLAKAVGALRLADDNLTDLQPKIADLVPAEWVPVFDVHVDPVLTAVRATIAELTGGKDD